MPKFHIRNLWIAAQSYFKKPHQYVPDGNSLAGCSRCFELVMANAGVALMAHLAKEHGLSEPHTCETLAWVSLRVYRHKIRERQNENES